MERDERKHGDEGEEFVHPDPVTDAALNWLFTLQAEPDDERLRAEFEKWRNADPANSRTFVDVAGAWDLPEMDLVAADLAARTGHSGSNPNANVIDYRRPKRSFWTSAAMAAAAAVLLAVGIQQYPVLMLQWRADYQTATGALQEVTLPDGSRMTLNTASAVALDFKGATRSVTLLQGEAYFDVVSDPSRPFTVASAFAEVEVKGTAFSVRTEATLDTVVLERGHINVEHLPDRTARASLEAGESITASPSALSEVKRMDPGTSLAWLQGMAVFEDRPFGQVIQEVGRYYNHSIVVANGNLGQVRVNGNYRLDNPERVIRSLATAAGASVTRLPGGILILR